MAAPTLPDLGITVKQDTFCRLIYAGCTQRSAYLQAYNAQNMKIESVDHEAMVLMDNPHIANRIANLRTTSESHDPLICAPNERKRKLSEIVRTPVDIQEVRPRDIVSASDQLNKMDRLYAESAPTSQSYTLNVIVDTPETRGLIDRLLAGGGRPDGQPPLALDGPVIDVDTEPSST